MIRRLCTLTAIGLAGWVVLNHVADRVEPGSPAQAREAAGLMATVERPGPIGAAGGGLRLGAEPPHLAVALGGGAPGASVPPAPGEALPH